MSNHRCTNCGEIIPYGRDVCWGCEHGYPTNENGDEAPKYIESYGAKLSQPDVRDYKVAYSSNEELPEGFQLDFMPKVKNQGNVGSCVAHAIAVLNEWFNMREYQDKTTKMSVGFIYGNRQHTPHVGRGMHIRDTLKTMCADGNVPNHLFDYNEEVPEITEKFKEKYSELKNDAYPFRFKSYAKLKDEEDIKRALMTTGPVIFAIKTYTDTKYKNGLLVSNQRKSDSKSAHCMVIYGWNKKGWLVQNSWGTYWGNKGRCVLPYDYKINEAWSVIDETVEGVEIVKPFNSKFKKFIAKILNAILRIVNEIFEAKENENGKEI